jgi:hypothetical protein
MELLEKAGAPDDPEPLTARIGGVISTDSVDLQGESIDQDGLEWDYFLKSGWINWEHQPGPENILGEPIRVYRDGNKTKMEAKLYLTVPKAKQIYQTLCGMQKAGTSRRIGYSVEGKVRQRLGKRVTKALVLNTSVTAHPVNRDSYMEILKGLDILKATDAGYQTPSLGGGSLGPLMPQSLQGAPDIATYSADEIAQALREIFPNIREGLIRQTAWAIKSITADTGFEALVGPLRGAFPRADLDTVLVAARTIYGEQHERA